MTASLHRLGSGSEAGLYYTNDSRREARPDRRDEYYTRDGGGRWWSSEEAIVRHGAAVDAGTFRDLCAGRDPRTGAALVRGAGENHWSGLDLTLTPGKSVSVLWAAGDEAQRAKIEAAHRKAVDRALSFLVDEKLVEVRTGAGGVERHAPSDLIVAQFEHYTTRMGDPNIHTHSVIMNVAGAPPGATSGRYSARHLTIEPAKVFQWQRAVGAAYRAELAETLREKFGFEYRPAGRGQWEIAGVPEEVLEQFSKRSAQIAERAGQNASSAQREIAALATRQSKEALPTGPELEARWRDELTSLGHEPWAGALSSEPTLDRGPYAQERDDRSVMFDPPELDGQGPVAQAASALFRHESVIDRKALLQLALEQAALQGLGLETVERELQELERSGCLLSLAGDGRSECWTTPAVAACEAAMQRAAGRLQERDWFLSKAVEAALAEAPHLAAEQQAAVRHVANRDGVVLLEAGAGTGKTTTAKALVDAAQRSNLKVIGLAPSWVAADELARSTGVEAQAIARWRHDFAKKIAVPLDAATLIVVDEAAMVGTRDMEAILAAAKTAGAKVVLVGDRRQLASVAGASALKAVVDVVERSVVLEGVRRQEVDWQRAASVLMARGDAEAGLRAYAANDRVELVSGEDAAQARVIKLWRRQREQYGDDVLIVTRRNRDAAALNERARAALHEEGVLGPDVAEAASLDRSDKRTLIKLAVGDRLRFGETLPQFGVRNGTRAVVDAVTPRGDGDLTARLSFDDGRTLEAAWSSLARQPLFGRKAQPPRIVHAYAGTAYAAQGRTADAAVLYIAREADARETYVGLTRHHRDARVVVERQRLDALCRQRQADPRIAPTTAAIQERLFSEARQYREKANVIDYVADRVAFVRVGSIELGSHAGGPNVGRAIQAARALSRALRGLNATLSSVPTWLVIRHGAQELLGDVSRSTRDLLEAIRARLNQPKRSRHPKRSIEVDR